MNSEDSNLWLKKLIDTEKFDAWLAVSFLYRYPTVGIHEYICKKLKHTENINIVIPQLIHIFLYHSDSEISRPICYLMKYWSFKSKKFFLSLYFYLKGCIETLDNKKSIHCYFLLCELTKAENRHFSVNTKVLKWQLKYKMRIHKTSLFQKEKRNTLNLDGIFLSFFRSVAWVCDLKMFKAIKEYEKKFQQPKIIAKINWIPDFTKGNAFKSDLIKSSVMFIESLIDISNRIKKLPKLLRQKGLEMELKLLNCNLPDKITLPFSNNKYVLSIKIEYSWILNSAENTPYILTLEVADEYKDNEVKDLKQINFLLQQLNAVAGLTYISDGNNIKDNVFTSLDKILTAERLDNELTKITLHQKKSRNRKRVEKQKKDNLHLETTNIASVVFEKTIDDGIHKKKTYESFRIDKNTSKDFAVNYDDLSSVFFSAKELHVEVNETNTTPSILNVDDWTEKTNRVKETSKYKAYKNWGLVSFIIKTGCTLKQEIIAYQILKMMKQIWQDEKKDIWVYAYQIYFVNNTAGLVESVKNAISIHKIKEKGKQYNRNFSLKTYFIDQFGIDTAEYKAATYNFLISLVGYSLACFLLQIKDRHNGNILLDNKGHIIHVDFGFILGDHPGFYCVEVAPFKFSSEYEELLKDFIEDFKILFLEGFHALRKHSEKLCRILEMLSENSDIRCINKKVLNNFKDRLKLEMSDKEIETYVLWLINKSINSMGTGLYDSYQYFSHGYL